MKVMLVVLTMVRCKSYGVRVVKRACVKSAADEVALILGAGKLTDPI